MPEIGYTLSSEEHGGRDLVRYAQRAEEVGFSFAVVSDHFHPWTDRQGHSPFVWTVIGGVAATTQNLRLGTGVTAPILRIHPAIVAQAAATAAEMMEGRFFLGLGSGEHLNEHVLGQKWPPAAVRLEMLEESIEVMRALWTGEWTSHRGRYFTVENARIYTRPDAPPPILVAAAGPKAAQLAGRAGDGLIGTAPESELIANFQESGGGDKPRYGQVAVCWDEDEDSARRIAHEWWPNAALPGELGQELPLPRHFEQAAKRISVEDVADSMPCGPDPDVHVKAIQEFYDAGYTHVWVHQIGPRQEEFLRFYAKEVLPGLPL
ncbi:MAG: TIGR03557 family F420-dependent LLM class oxidoreductase [Actinomycetota bacterium]